MTQTRDLIKKMADFFTGEEFYEKGEDARLELSPDDVRCMNEVIKACGNAISRQAVKEQMIKYGFHAPDMTVTEFVEDLPSVKPQEQKAEKVIKMREATPEERESIDKYIKSISKPTGVNVFDFYKDEQTDGDLISRQAVLKQLKGCLTGGETEYEYVKIHIDSIPPVKPQEPKTGHWIYDRTRDWDGECKYECSECGMGSDVDYPYCMRCGAKMEG